jgi:integrase
VEDWASSLGNTCLPSTVEQYVGRLHTWCTVAGKPFPGKEALAGYRLIMRGQRRDAWRDVRRAAPLRGHHLRRYDALFLSNKRAADIRFRAMLFICHGAMLRASELLKLKASDIHVSEFGVRISVRASNDKMRVGRGPAAEVWIPAEGSQAREALLAWQRVFTPAGPEASAWAWETSYGSWNRMTKAVGKALGVEGTTTSHSLRAGGCTDLLQGGCPPELVRRMGRWKSSTYLQYFRPSGREMVAHLGAALSAVNVAGSTGHTLAPEAARLLVNQSARSWGAASARVEHLLI